MKHLITALVATAITFSASAKLDGDGYYRVQNAKTERYIYVLDDKGELNFQATTAELGAIELWMGYDKTISDPATIIYVKDLNGKKQDYDFQTQGTGVQAIINYPVSIRLYNSSLGTYSIFGRNSGITRYIGDATQFASEQGWVAHLGNGEYYRWYFHPLTTDDSNYFGITPEFQQGADHYATLYADFPFDFHSEGMTAYYVSSVENGTAYIKEINGTVAKGTPVIIKCSSAVPSGNKLNLGGSGSAVAGNMLKGVYFNNNDLVHKNRTPNDKATMRVLGRLSDGSIGFVTSNEQYLARNKAYLVVPAGTPAELKMEIASNAAIGTVTSDAVTISINGLELRVDGAEDAVVYNITGQLISRSANANSHAISLPAPGIYIVKAGSKVAKLIAR